MSQTLLNSLIPKFGATLMIEDNIFSDEVLFKKHLIDCIMKKSIFNNITFDHITFSSVKLSQCQFNNCKFNKSSLGETELYRSKFQNFIFTGSAITASNFDDAGFYFCQFEESSFF